MNERMLDLAIQARDWAYADHDGYTAQMLFEQKFAELIVRECAYFVVLELEGQVGSLIADRTANRLEEHFGVE
jgi:hypothetical protein